MVEEWRDIPGYEAIYQASSYGRIRSAEGKTTVSTRHGVRRWKSRVLKPKSCKDFRAIGYRVTLWKDKAPHDYLVARLVAATFLGVPISTKLTVNHKDGDRLNNHVENLEFLTLSQNIRYGFENGQYKQNRTTLTNINTGESCSFASMSKAGLHIGRDERYISAVAKKGKNATGIDGVVYAVYAEESKSIKAINQW